MKIAVYAICKDEEKNIQDFLENVMTADHVVLVDTGSTDRTPELINEAKERLNLTYAEALFEPFSFSQARNFCLAQVPEDVDYCLYLDLDERLEEGWRKKLEPLLAHNPTHITMDMVTARDETGQPTNSYYQTRCHMRYGYSWKYPCHEVLQCAIPYGDKRAISSSIQVEHFPDLNKDRNYLHLLEAAADEYPNDQRMLYYYGRELYMDNRPKGALFVLDRACHAKDLWWDKQTASCFKFMALSALKLEDIGLAETYYLKYLSYSTDEAEAWYDIALFYYEQKLYHMALGYAKRCINLSQSKSKPSNFLFRDLSCWTWKPHDIAAYCSYHIKDMPGYALHATLACNANPQDERLQANVQDALTHVTVVERTVDAEN